MTKATLQDIERALLVQDEIINEYKRLREKKINSLLKDERWTEEDTGAVNVLEHLLNLYGIEA